MAHRSPIAKGVTQVEAKYDRWGNRTEVACFDANHKLVADKTSGAIFRTKFDDRGNKIEERFFDANQRPQRMKSGHTVIRWKYDSAIMK